MHQLDSFLCKKVFFSMYNICAVIFVTTIVVIKGLEPIPSDLRNRLKSAHSFNELMRMMTLLYTPPSGNRGLSRFRNTAYGGTENDRHHRIKMKGASFIALSTGRRSQPTSQVEIDGYYYICFSSIHLYCRLIIFQLSEKFRVDSTHFFVGIFFAKFSFVCCPLVRLFENIRERSPL